jgi:hypothetical protein
VDHLSCSAGICSCPGLPLEHRAIHVEAEVFLILEGGSLVLLLLLSSFSLHPNMDVDLKSFLSVPGGGHVDTDGLESGLWLDDDIDGRECFGGSGFVAWPE